MIHNPHDALFRSVLGEPEHARGALQAMTPAVLAEVVDWSTLTLQPGTFVDTELRFQHTDLLFSVARQDGSETLIYFLFEHQSSPPTEGLMAFRLLSYQVRIWARWRADHPKAKALPMIVPIVMYHGGESWSEPLSFDALLDLPAGVRPEIDPYLVQFTYVLDDLSKISDDELREGAQMTALAKLVAMCFKHARTRSDFLQLLSRWMEVVREVAAAPHGLEALRRTISYILEVNEYVEPEALQALLEREIGPQAKDAIVTAGQRLIEQGRQEGLLEGQEKAHQESRQAFQRSLLHLLRQRFGDEVDAHAEQRVTAASVEQLQAWIVRVLSVSTLTELLAD